MHPDTRLGPVHLNVRDISAQTDFYTRTLGLQAVPGPTAETVSLHAGGPPIITLHHTPQATHPGRATGLFHAAILLPSRADLARFLHHLAQSRYPLQGASDHLVSEALYLADPEGNGLEVYRDRPREQWPFEDGRLQMATDPLDLNALLLEATGSWNGMPGGTTLGHIHLRVNDISAAEGFYRDQLGFDLMTRYGAQATFLSVGGYHHHIGANVWGTVGAPPAEPGSLGLRAWELHAPGGVDHPAAKAIEGGVTLVDPAGIRVIVRDVTPL